MPDHAAHARANAFHALISAALLLAYGFGFAPEAIGGSPLYARSVDAVRITAQAGGCLLAAAAVLGLAGLEASLWLDALVSGAVGIVLAIGGGYWLVSDGDWTGLVLGAFGLIMLSEARRSAAVIRSPGEPKAPATAPEPAPHPAESPRGIPRIPNKSVESGEADGYLAAIGQEARKRTEAAPPPRDPPA